jgi:hypothetical protein
LLQNFCGLPESWSRTVSMRTVLLMGNPKVTSPAFPVEPTKMEIKLKVTKVKEDWVSRGVYGDQHVIILMGEVEGYREFGYIRLGATTAFKFADNPEDLKGKTVLLRGTFNSNGKMVFGKRVRPVKVV